MRWYSLTPSAVIWAEISRKPAGGATLYDVAFFFNRFARLSITSRAPLHRFTARVRSLCCGGAPMVSR